MNRSAGSLVVMEMSLLVVLVAALFLLGVPRRV
jgi:hypothetical protein